MKPKGQVGTYEAKTHLPKLLEKVARGERITITRHGLPIAMLVPVESADKPNPEKSIEQLLAFAHKHPLKKASIREMIEEGRRY
jgi:prevent-host-death family protein